ncbi:MAG: Gfo/Idh/MocA family oxidoreductase [Myxococcales bacterium]|nr:Gfo/Idh/MocA family oxidoreductase [Myxococcales bacterium]
MSQGSRLPVAVVGAGGWGRNHVRNFAALQGAELRYVCDRSEPARARAAELAPSARLVSEPDAMLRDESLAAVIIATDAPSHYIVAKRALEAGKDVFVEKPLALSVGHARELVALAGARGRILMVGHLLLYHPAVTALKAMIDGDELGELLYIYSQRLNLGVVRQDENAWWSLAPHDLSVANYLLGSEPEAVAASGGIFLQPGRGIEDVVFATVHYPGGRIANVHVSWLDPHKTRRLTVVGSKKMAIFDDTSPDKKLTIYDKGAEPPNALTYDQGVRLRTGDIRIPALRMNEPLRRECEAFLEAVRSRRSPLADGASGLSVVRTLEAGSRSLAEGGHRVSIEAGSPS